MSAIAARGVVAVQVSTHEPRFRNTSGGVAGLPLTTGAPQDYWSLSIWGQFDGLMILRGTKWIRLIADVCREEALGVQLSVVDHNLRFQNRFAFPCDRIERRRSRKQHMFARHPIPD